MLNVHFKSIINRIQCISIDVDSTKHKIEENIKKKTDRRYMSLYIYWSIVLTERFSIPNKNQTKRYKFLNLNFDLSLYILYFYRKSMECVIKIIRL